MNERLALLRHPNKFPVSGMNDAMNARTKMIRTSRWAQRNDLLRIDKNFLIVWPGQPDQSRAVLRSSAARRAYQEEHTRTIA